jgi:adenosylcobinamide kinase/adenosylcobinamide-phosphate guanylyltransferase
MRLHLITGGARSGKSTYAQDLAWRLGGRDVTFVATARAIDDEMQRRIARHQAERPAGWRTTEAPHDAGVAITNASTPVVLLDCLTILLSNAAERSRAPTEEAVHDAMAAEVSQLLTEAGNRDGDLVIVTNEVGWGVHPETDIGRWFRDGLGVANQRMAAAADRVVVMISGIPLALSSGNGPGE